MINRKTYGEKVGSGTPNLPSVFLHQGNYYGTLFFVLALVHFCERDAILWIAPERIYEEG